MRAGPDVLPKTTRSLVASRGLQWLLLSSIWSALILFFATQMVAVDRVTWQTAFTFSLLDWGPWIVLSPLVLWFARRVHIESANWRRTLPAHILVGILIAGGLEFGARYAWELGWIPRPPWPGNRARAFEPRPAGERVPPPPPPNDGRDGPRGPGFGNGPGAPDVGGPPPGEGGPRPLFRRAPGPMGGGQFIRARLALPIYFLLVAAAHAVAYHRRSLERERRALTAEAQLASARLMALQNQLHPHFLFNTLNGISSLVYVSPAAADEMICALSELLRTALEVSERKEVTLREELQFIERYLAIQRMRFADRLTSRNEIAPGLENVLVPTLILQPLVENAVVHGIAAQSEKGTVIVRAETVGDRLVLTVSDTGIGAANGTKKPDGSLQFSEGIGLANTRARLAALYGESFHLTLTSSPTGGVVARIELPLHTQASGENPHAHR